MAEERGKYATNSSAVVLLVNRALAEKLLERPAVAPLIAEGAERIEFRLTHEALEDQAPGFRIESNATAEFGGEFEASR